MKKKICLILLVLVMVISIFTLSSCKDEKFTISFYVDDSLYHTIETSGNEILNFPTTPTKSGYTFNGWYQKGSSSEFKDSAFSNQSLNANISVYASFSKEAPKALTPTEVYENLNDSVVFVLITKLNGIASGSGFFIDENGTFVTNYHVIRDGIDGSIKLANGTVAKIVNVVGYSEERDIAILSTDAENTKPVKIADSDSVKVGANVYAIGYPEAFDLGISSSTFTSGMVSTLRTLGDLDYIQATVEITHGNSGGALINEFGEVIGITSGGISLDDIDYMNLSIPINHLHNVKRDVNESLLITTKRHYPVFVNYYVDGELFKIDSYEYEAIPTPMEAPQKNGYTFVAWSINDAENQAYNFEEKLISPIHLYAIFEINSYNITFNTGDDTFQLPTSYNVTNSQQPLPAIEKNGYIFEGWMDKNGNFIDTYPTADALCNLELTAKWVEGSANVLTIENNVITACDKNAVNVVIPASYRGVAITKIAENAFYDCSNLTSVIIPDSVETLGECAFAYCSKLSELTLGNSIKLIGNYAFSGCAGLTSITIPDSVTSIGSSALYNCTSLTSITIPFVGGTKNGGYNTHFGYIFGASGYSYNDDYVPTSLKTVIITGGSFISDSAFKDCTSLTSVTIPNSVTIIGSSAFSGCAGLTSITIPNGVTIIESSVFSGCAGLTSITIPDSVGAILEYAFADCSKLSELTLGNSIKRIGDYAFRDCTSITSITIPDSVTIIESSSFSGCEKIIEKESGVYYVDKWVVDSDNNITSVSLRENTVGIGPSAFSGCKSLTSITIPNGVARIGDYSFSGCTSLTSITIPNGVARIGDFAFYNCYSITSITIPDSVETLGDCAFAFCSKLSELTLGNSIEIIGESAFYKCTGLTSVVITGGRIESSAFLGCISLTSVVITDSVKSIYAYAFSDCTSLANIKYTGTETQWKNISKSSYWYGNQNFTIIYNYNTGN